MAPRLTAVPLEPGAVARALDALPKRAGVAQLLGPGGRNLLIGRPANLRSWVAAHLGRGRPPRKGARPPTDLSPVAAAVAYAETTSPFAQRVAFERLMAQHVPPAKRRDLKPAGWIDLDLAARFPRAVARAGAAGPTAFGPFRSKEAALRAIALLHKLFPLRPCDFAFEPDPALALGLGCVYAQVRTCAAPCLGRVGEEDYGALAGRAAAFLAAPWDRAEETRAWLPEWVAGSDARALVVETGASGLELFPVRSGAVLDERRLACAPEDLADALETLAWAPAEPPRDDMPWLVAWLHARRKTGAFLVLRDGAPSREAAARLRS